MTFERFAKSVNSIYDYFLLTQKIVPPHHKWKSVVFERTFAGTSLVRDLRLAISAFLRGDTPRPMLESCLTQIESVEPSDFEGGFDANRVHLVTSWCVDDVAFKSLRQMLQLGVNVITPEEWGLIGMTGRKSHYDACMRLCDRARSHFSRMTPASADHLGFDDALFNESDTVRLKRALYANFVIWRKIRVIEKSLKRDLPFVTLWYSSEVILEILRAYYRLAGGWIDWLDTPSHLNQLDIPEVFRDLLLTPGALQDHFLAGKQHHLTTIFWRTYWTLQDNWRRKKWVEQAHLEDPLATQFEIEYWKYEGLFC